MFFTNIKHLDFRSGNLEVMVMLGYEVLYLEEKMSRGGKRMEQWHNIRVEDHVAGYERMDEYFRCTIAYRTRIL
ncbi:hypothetical protein [Chryseobacterium sp.]|uniref:hypothetical protein n=1 Tax=Chryseobacterium sp. TaxID=1871047 RepID=UPI0025C539E0|nr:hypothetical protein [Chryseobacterium sp.]MBV8324972.1 hypothetical protein [Chryseobacterium sp.]